MIKPNKKNIQKEKSNNNQTSKAQKIFKQRSKNILESKFTSTKSKLNSLKSPKNNTESKFSKKRTHNSISSKEEVNIRFPPKSIRNKMNQNIFYNNTCGNTNISNNNNKLLTSNLFLTNDTDIPIPDEEKKMFKKSKFANNNDEKVLTLPELETISKKNKFKKTIIIDDEGNNNLHMNIKKGENDYKKLLNNENNNSIFLINSINSNTETNSLFTNDSKIDFSKMNLNKYNMNKDNKNIITEKEIKQSIIDDSLNKENNEEEKRIKEYTKIFNLLNTNIEQFKKMFHNNNSDNNIKAPNPKEPKDKNIQKINNNINNNQNNIKQSNKRILLKNKKIIQSKLSNKAGGFSVKKNMQNPKERSLSKKSNPKLKKNFSEKNLSSSSKRLKVNQNIFTIDVRNDIEKELNSDTKIEKSESNNAISSFLESSIQDEFYQSLINQNYSNIIEDDKKMKDDVIMSVNIDEKGQDEKVQDIQDSKIFRGKRHNKDTNFDNNKSEEKNEDKMNCFIF